MHRINALRPTLSALGHPYRNFASAELEAELNTPPRCLFPVDRDPLYFLSRPFRFRQGHGEDAVLERRRHLILLDVVDWNAALEPAIITLAEQPVLVFRFGFLFAFDCENAIRKLDLEVLLV